MLSHYDDDDDDEILRRLGEDPEEIEDDSPDGHPSTPQEPSDDREPDLANEEAEDDEDDGTTDTPTRDPVEQSVSFLAKQAGYTLPADTAITFGASAAPEPEEQPPAQTLNPDTSLDTGPHQSGVDGSEFRNEMKVMIKTIHSLMTRKRLSWNQILLPTARDGFFVVLGAVELKSNLKQPRVRKPAVKDPKKQSLGGGNLLLSPQNPAPQSTSHKATQAKKIDSDAVTHGGTAAFPVTLPKNNVQSHEGTAALPVTLPENVQSHEAALHDTFQEQRPITKPSTKPQPSTSQAPSSATARPSGIQPISHNARPLQSNSPKLIHGELLPAKRKEAGPLPRPLEEALDSLKVEIEAASPFIPKKFPNELKPSTLRVAQMALDMNEYDECFFTRLASCFPYNTSQSKIIQKFVKREILPQRKAYYDSQISERIARLKQMVTEGMPAARADYEAALLEYEAAKRVYGHEEPLRPNSGRIHGKAARSKMNLAMRELIYELIKLEDELCETIKDTQKIVDKNVTIKDTSNRRQFYLRVQLSKRSGLHEEKTRRKYGRSSKPHHLIMIIECTRLLLVFRKQ
ncbi:hypothetical protein KEM48_001861 [Puccinia striiformis f. sp. tritici PST-130]|nr:hypothetical protein KEM48_001861 [Puccinia striiformis f. sp. tritici PST-130]